MGSLKVMLMERWASVESAKKPPEIYAFKAFRPLSVGSSHQTMASNIMLELQLAINLDHINVTTKKLTLTNGPGGPVGTHLNLVVIHKQHVNIFKIEFMRQQNLMNFSEKES